MAAIPAGDAYEVLGVPAAASAEEIRQAYLRECLRLHPDKQGVLGVEHFQRLHEAYDVLRDPASRRELDARRADEARALTTSALRAEQVGLDDMDYDEASEAWVHACRCGGMYEVPSDAVPGEGPWEMVVGCDGCSLHICVRRCTLGANAGFKEAPAPRSR